MITSPPGTGHVRPSVEHLQELDAVFRECQQYFREKYPDGEVRLTKVNDETGMGQTRT